MISPLKSNIRTGSYFRSISAENKRIHQSPRVNKYSTDSSAENGFLQASPQTNVSDKPISLYKSGDFVYHYKKGPPRRLGEFRNEDMK